MKKIIKQKRTKGQADLTAEIKQLYEDFFKKLTKIEAERDRKIIRIIKRIEARQLAKLRLDLRR